MEMAKTVQDLKCWQLANQLRNEVIAICAQETVRKHLRFCDGFTEAAGSVCRNISEGFGRGGSAAIVQFFDYALGSLAEVDDYLRESLSRSFVDIEHHRSVLELKEHTRATTLNFKKVHQQKVARRAASRRSGQTRGT